MAEIDKAFGFIIWKNLTRRAPLNLKKGKKLGAWTLKAHLISVVKVPGKPFVRAATTREIDCTLKIRPYLPEI